MKKDYLEKIEQGIDRYSAVVSFNEGFYKLRRTDTSFLSEVAFTPRVGVNSERRQSNHISKLVIAYMAETKWSSVYGLNYTDTMNLTYAEWGRMQNQLNIQGLQSLKDIELPPKES